MKIIAHNDRNCLGFSKPITTGVKNTPLETFTVKEDATEQDFVELKGKYDHLMLLGDDGRELREFHRYETDSKFFLVNPKDDSQPYARVRYSYYDNKVICASCDSSNCIMFGKYELHLGGYEIGYIRVKALNNWITLLATVKDGKLLMKARHSNGKDSDTEWYDVTDVKVEEEHRQLCIKAVKEVVDGVSKWNCDDYLKQWVLSRLEYTNTKARWED